MTQAGRILLVLGAALIAAQPVNAMNIRQNGPTQSPPGLPCGERDRVVQMLKETYGERASAHGLAHTGAVAEVFISPRGTWTIIATSPDGVSCVVGAGDSWQTTIARDDTI